MSKLKISKFHTFSWLINSWRIKKLIWIKQNFQLCLILNIYQTTFWRYQNNPPPKCTHQIIKTQDLKQKNFSNPCLIRWLLLPQWLWTKTTIMNVIVGYFTCACCEYCWSNRDWSWREAFSDALRFRRCLLKLWKRDDNRDFWSVDSNPKHKTQEC